MVLIFWGRGEVFEVLVVGQAIIRVELKIGRVSMLETVLFHSVSPGKYS